MWFALLLSLSLAYFWYSMPRASSNTGVLAAPTRAVAKGASGAVAAYRKYVNNLSGTPQENRGNVDALMAKQGRIERALFEDNQASNPQFARHVDQLQAMGMPSHTVQSMNSAIRGDLQESLMADRNVSALKPETMTAPSVVGQFARTEELVPQQQGDSLSRATGLTDQLLPGPKATTTTDGLPALAKDQTQALSAAVDAGIMAPETGPEQGIASVFAETTSAGADADSAELLAAAVSAADRG